VLGGRWEKSTMLKGESLIEPDFNEREKGAGKKKKSRMSGAKHSSGEQRVKFVNQSKAVRTQS